MNFGQFQPANQMETIILVSLFTGQIYYFSVFLFFFCGEAGFNGEFTNILRFMMVSMVVSLEFSF